MAWLNDKRQRLLDSLSQELGMPPERIRATAAWRRLCTAADSLDIVELVMDLEEELGQGSGSRA